MDDDRQITSPAGEHDVEGAQRVFEDFLTLYQPALVRVEYYLEQVIEQIDPAYAEAYRPWHQSLHDLFRGVYLAARKIPIPDHESFMEAVRVFSFDSAIQFLRDICLSCRLTLSPDWTDRFRKHINLLLFSCAILNRHQQEQAITH